MRDEKTQGREHESHNRQNPEKGQNPEKNKEQKRRAPGSEQEYQGDESNERRGNVDQEWEEKERKRA